VKNGSLNATAIQKIISATILLDGKVVGVIQISRKRRPQRKPVLISRRTISEAFWRCANRWEN
jgi:hypothetical protein